MTAHRIAHLGEPTGQQAHCEGNAAHRILVVEGDAAIRQFSTEALMLSGYEVDAVADGADGWEALQASGYDLLITDNRRPRMSGIDLLKKLRSARVDLPVIMVTSALSDHEFDQYPWLIPDATLLKPFTVEKLLGTVKAVLRALTVRGLMAPPPNGQSRPSLVGLRL